MRIVEQYIREGAPDQVNASICMILHYPAIGGASRGWNTVKHRAPLLPPLPFLSGSYSSLFRAYYSQDTCISVVRVCVDAIKSAITYRGWYVFIPM